MQTAPEMFQRAASFDWEALLPVLFFLLYGIAQLLGNKKKKQQQEEGNEGDADALERARQIREEIRRRIEERKPVTEGGAAAPASPSAYDPTLPDNQQQAPQVQQRNLQQSQPRPSQVQPERTEALHHKKVREVLPETEPSPGPNLEELLAKQRKRLEESRRKQRQARAQAVEMEKQAAIRRRQKGAGPVAMSGDLRTDLLAGLRHPDSIRQAILYREILGKPLGLK